MSREKREASEYHERCWYEVRGMVPQPSIPPLDADVLCYVREAIIDAKRLKGLHAAIRKLRKDIRSVGEQYERTEYYCCDKACAYSNCVDMIDRLMRENGIEEKQ